MFNIALKYRLYYRKKRDKFTGKEQDIETGLYYYGARYLDPRDSRWLSVDPAMGEYVPGPGQEAGKLPGMGGVFNTVNLHVYHYAGNNPVKYVDPDGRDINENIINNTEKEIQQTAISYKLNNLINTDKLADLMLSNPDYLDSASAAGIGNMSQSELSEYLGNINVYAVSDWSKVEAVIDILEMPKAPGGGEMLSVGNNIYVRNTMDLNSMNNDTAELLGHETIHSLQAAGMGKMAFLNAYKQTGNYANAFETTAYNWGGASYGASKPQLLPANPYWWRR